MPRIGPVRLAREDRVVERIEGAHQPRAGQIFLRHHADAFVLGLIGKGRAVARGDGVAGIEHDLALHRRAVVLADLRQRRIGHGDEEDLADVDRLLHRAGLSVGAEPGDEVLELLGMARGKQHLVAVLRP